jgi:hypothetical protein
MMSEANSLHPSAGDKIDAPLSSYSYALIDPIQMAEPLARGDFEGLALKPLVPESLEADEPKLPLLVDLEILDEEDQQYWWQILEKARQHHQPPVFCALLQGPRGVASRIEIKEHLTKQLIQRNRRLNQRFLLRYYDPRVFAHLRWILQPHQLALLFGPLFRWSYIHRGEWHSVDAPLSDTKHTIESLIISANQWEQLNSVADINEIFKRVAEEQPEIMRGDFTVQAQQIFSFLERALQVHDLQDPEDRKVFAFHGMTISSLFDSHPLIQEILKRLQSDDEAQYQYETAALTPEQWQAIKLNHTPHR